MASNCHRCEYWQNKAREAEDRAEKAELENVELKKIIDEQLNAFSDAPCDADLEEEEDELIPEGGEEGAESEELVLEGGDGCVEAEELEVPEETPQPPMRRSAKALKEAGHYEVDEAYALMKSAMVAKAPPTPRVVPPPPRSSTARVGPYTPPPPSGSRPISKARGSVAGALGPTQPVCPPPAACFATSSAPPPWKADRAQPPKPHERGGTSTRQRALTAAAKRGDWPEVKRLGAEHARIQAKHAKESALLEAAAQGDTALVQELMNS